MSRSSGRAQRMHLYNLGNDRCPLCLKPFSKEAVEGGKTVTLEHVPPKGLVGATSIAMCLTCRNCNKGAGEGADQAAATLARHRTNSIKVRVDYPSMPPQTGKWLLGDDKLETQGRSDIKTPPPPLTPGDSITVTFTVPKAQFAVISHIKSAYLSVVSLLGRHGFRYGESKALAPVREQIAEPSKEIITHAACIVQSPDKLPDGIIMSRERRCWAVKIDSYVVLLPRGEDESFYEDIGDWLPDGKGNIGGFWWSPVKFGGGGPGRTGYAVVTLEEADQMKARGVDNLFGMTYTYIHPNGAPQEFVVADHQGLVVTLISQWAAILGAGPRDVPSA